LLGSSVVSFPAASRTNPYRTPGHGRHLAHDGQVITLRSNARWCSDVFEIACWNGEAVRVAFVLDSCDREVISWVASTCGMSGGMVRDLMVEAVGARFGPVPRTSHRIEWLSDNGSCYTAHQTQAHAFSLGLIPCFTPVQSPESNGMAEAFIKSFKRDYVAIHDRPDAATVLAKLTDWFEDYNDVRPHRGLRMRSPREFLRSQISTATCPV
jgi:putative transposase